MPKTAPKRAEDLPLPWFRTGMAAAVIAAVAGTYLLFATSLNDVYMLPKQSVLLLVGAGTVVLVAWALATQGSVRLRSRSALLAAIVFLFVMLLATMFNDARAAGLFGSYGRSDGLLTYAVAVLLLVGIVAATVRADAVRLLWWIAGVGGAVVLYGTLQALGAEPFDIPDKGAVVASLGQINFVGGFVGIALPLFCWIASDRARPVAARASGAVLALLAVLVGVKSNSFQAYVGLAVGALAYGTAYAATRLPRRTLLLGAAAAVVALAAVVGVGHARIEDEVRAGMNERVLLWQAAGSMIADRPVLGSGPTGYGSRFGAERPAAHARQFGLDQISDAPHDVPLAMGVSGGVLLLVAYLVFVAFVGLALVRGVRRTEGAQRLALCAAGAAWLAYQAQSLISIDVPPLIVTHFVLAGIILALAGDEPFTLGLPALVRRSGRGRTETSTAGRVVQGVGVLLALLLVWFGTFRPLIADSAFVHGRQKLANQDPEGALVELNRSTGDAPWQGQYWALKAAALAASGDQDAALAAGSKASRLRPSAVTYALSTAQLAARMDRPDVAERWFRFALRNGPHLGPVSFAYGEFLGQQARYDDAIRQMRAALVERPDDVRYLASLASTYEAADRNDDALATWRRILALEPQNATALAAQNRLLGRPPT